MQPTNNTTKVYDQDQPQAGGSLDGGSVQSYASDMTQSYRLESLEEPLEVHSVQSPSFAGQLAPHRGVRFGSFFSRRKAMIVSVLITALVLLLTLVSMAFLVRQGPKSEKNAQTAATQQDVKIDNAASSSIPQELQGAQQSLLVSGDIITRGSLKISDSGYVTVIRVQNPTSNQTVTLPGTSGTICLDTNNCGYGSQNDVTALQGQQGALQSQLDELNGLINSLGQITIPPAGVTELNGQKGSVSIQGSTNRVSVNTSGGVVTVTTPQDLDANANVQFGSLTLSPTGQIRANTLIQTAAGNNVSINAGNDAITFVAGGRVFSLPTTGGAAQTICTTGATCATGSGTAVLLSPGTAQVDGTADSSIFINDTGGGSLVHLQSGGVDRFTIGNTGDTTIGGSLTVSGLGNGFVRSTGGTLGVVTAINLGTDVTGVLPVANGGTGANNANSARSNLGAAASGANGDITSTTALNTITPSGALTVGTPTQQFTLQGASNSSISAGSGANITTLAFAAPSGTNTITFPALTGTVCVSAGNCAAAGAAGGDLTGTYPNPTIARLQGANLNITGSSNGQILVYNGANSRWENASVSGDVSLSGTGAATISANAVTTAKIADGNVTNAKLQNSSLTVTAGNGLLNGGSVSLGSSIALNIGQGDGITVNADDIAVDNTVCRTTGNCAGVGGNGDISGTGSNGRVALFNGAKTLTSSTLLQSAGSLTLDGGNNFVLTSGNLILSNGNVDVTGGGNFTGTVSGADAVQSDEFVTLAQLNAAIGGVGGGVDSLNALAGDLSLQGTAGQITISDNGTDTITLSLNSAVTLQGNTFNGVNQLVRLGASGELPVLNAANLTNLNASNLASGTVPSGRISGSYAGITGVGTVTTGTWNGNAIADTYVQDNITISGSGTVDWTALNNYPAACPAGQAITQLGDTITCQVFAAGSGSGNYIQNTTSNQDGANFNIQSVATGSVTAKFRVIGGQTADVMQVRDSGDTTTLFAVTSAGGVVATSFNGDGSALTNLNASNVSSGTLNTARIADGSLGNVKLQNSSLTVTAGGGLINGGSIALGGSATLNIGQGDGITVNADDIAVDNTVCRTTGNCAGVGGTGDITGGGTADRLALFNGAKNIVNSYLLQSAGTLTLDNGVDFVLAGGDINVTGNGIFTGTVSGADAVQNDEFVTLAQLNAAIGGVGGGVSSLNTLAGALTLQGTAGQVTVSDNGSNTITVALHANVTLQGNTFNGPDQLVKLDNTGALPVLDGSNLTNVNAALLQGQNGAYYLDLGNATGTLNIARIADTSITNAKLVNDSLTVTAGSGLTGGGTTALGGTTTLNIGAGDGITVNANDIAVDATVARLNANANFTASLQQGGNDVCTTAGNCAGVGGTGDITGSGTSGRLAVFDAAKNITNSYLLQSAGTLTLDTGTNFVLTAGDLVLSAGDVNVTGDGNFSGTVTATNFTGSGANLTNLNANEITSGTIASARISGSYTGITGVGTVTVGTWNGTAISDAYVQDNITISSTGTVDWAALSNYPAACAAGNAITALGDTVTCSPFSTGGSGVSTVGAIDSQTKSANGAVISGSSIYLQTADASNPGLVSTGSQTFAGNKTFNGSVVIASGQSLTITGGNTGSRPAGSEGMVYYDTDTDRLLIYSNGKWQADRSDTVLVAASNSSQADKDAADYVADGNTGAVADGDQVQINQALTAASGRKVVLLAGTYVADATILVPNNTILSGIGDGTLIELADLDATDNLIENSDTSAGTGVVVRDMRLNGRNDLNTAGVQQAVSLSAMGDAATNRNGALIENLKISNFRSMPLQLINSDKNTIIGNTVSGGGYGFVLDSSTHNVLSNNTIKGTSGPGFLVYNSSNYNTLIGNISSANDKGFEVGSSYNTFTGNTAESNTTTAFSVVGATNNKFTGNMASGGGYGFSLSSSSGSNTISGNTIQSTSVFGLQITGSNDNMVSGNLFYDNAGSLANSSIIIGNSDGTLVTGNRITDTAGTGYAINIFDNTSDATYLADNYFSGTGASSINDAGTGTIYGGQVNSSTNYVIQPAGTVELMKNTNVTGTLNITGDVDANGSLTVGNANQFVISNLGVVTSGTWQGTAVTDTYVADTLTVNSSSTVDWQALSNYPAACPAGNAITQLGDTITCSAFATGGDGGVTTIGAIDSQTKSANGAVISGTTIYLQTADASNPGLVSTGAQTFAGNKTFNGSVVLAASQSLTITGGNTGSRPAGAEGMVYYDTDTDRLLVFSNGKWQADRSDAVLVAASNSSQADKDAADYVADGNTGAAADGDQVEINQALTAASGKKVVLLAGTYTIDAAISVPNNTVVSGIGQGTIITIPNSFNTNINALSLGNNITVRDMQLDGNRTNQTSGSMYGLYFSASTGAKAISVTASNWRSAGLQLASANYNTITNSSVQNNGSIGIGMSASSNNIITDNTIQNNALYGIYVTGIDPNISARNTISGNNVGGSATGVYIYSDSIAANNNVTGNIVHGNTTAGIALNTTSGNLISDNSLNDNGGAGLNQAITLSGSPSNIVSTNSITDSAPASGSAIVLSAGSVGNYIADNMLGGGSISDSTPTSNTYGGQLNDAGNYVIQPASGTIELMKNTNVTGTLGVQVSNINAFQVKNGSGLQVVGVDTNAGILNVGSSTFVQGRISFANATNTNGIILQSVAAPTAARTIYLPDEDGTICLQNSANCGFASSNGSGSYIQNQSASAQSADFWISGNGVIDGDLDVGGYISGAGLQADTIASLTGTTVTFNSNVVLAASQSLTITGGNTASRPASPTEGMIYYDTTTKRLLTYANGKWQADRSQAVLVAASNSSQSDKDAADYVADGNTAAAADGDQVQINAALIAGAGKKIVLLAGTYTVDASISVPNNTTLAGVGNGTLITIPNSFNASIDAIVNTDGTTGSGIVIQDLKLDGNKANQSSSAMTAIELDTVGYAASTDGVKISNLTITNWRGTGIFTYQVYNSTFSGNIIRDNVNSSPAGNGIWLSWSSNNTVTNNVLSGNNYGIYTDSSANNTFAGNTFQNSVSVGLEIDYEGGNTVTGNTFWGNGLYGFRSDGSSENTISGNTFQDSGGATANNAIALGGGGNRNTVTGNTVSDASCTTTCNAIWISSGTGNYLAGNQIGTNGTILDAGTNTVYGGQVNGSTNFVVQPAGTVELMKNTNVTGTLNVTGSFDTNGSLTVGNANQFVISNTGVVTSGTWQAGTIGLLYGGTNNTSYTTNGVVYSNGTSLVSTGAGTNGQCLIATTGGAPSWTSCTATTLQGAYDASSTAPTPAEITLADNKNLRFTAADTGTDPSIVMKLNCTACGTGTAGNFLVQNNSSAALFSVAGDGDIEIGTANNGIYLSGSGGVTTGSFTLRGTARNSKTIRLLAEYPSAVLSPDGSNNTGTMTSGYDSGNRMSYYNWTTTQTPGNWDYDIIVQVPIPKDFDGWDANPLSFTGWTTDTTNGTVGIQVVRSDGNNDSHFSSFQNITFGATSTWTTRTFTNSTDLDATNYTAGDYMTVKVRLTVPTNGNARVGNITLNYLSKF